MLETLVPQLHLVRLSAAAIAVFALGCTGLIDAGGTGDLTPEQAAAREAWISEAQPVLAQNCAACHNGTRANIGFIEGADVMAQRDDLLAYEPVVVNLTAPQSSRILTKGLHEGPALTAAQLSSWWGSWTRARSLIARSCIDSANMSSASTEPTARRTRPTWRSHRWPLPATSSRRG